MRRCWMCDGTAAVGWAGLACPVCRGNGVLDDLPDPPTVDDWPLEPDTPPRGWEP